MARLYSNENFPFPAVEELRRLGHNILTIQETGFANKAMPDEEVLEFSCREKRILLTLNRKHFIKLHYKVKEHFGIVVYTYDLDYKALAYRIHDTLEKQADIKGQLIRINRPD